MEIHCQTLRRTVEECFSALFDLLYPFYEDALA